MIIFLFLTSILLLKNILTDGQQNKSMITWNRFSRTKLLHIPELKKKIRCLSFGDLVEDENEKEDIRLYFQNIRLVEKCIQTNPNSSIRNISEETRIPPTSVYRYLTKNLKYICFHLRWIQHESSKELKKI